MIYQHSVKYKLCDSPCKPVFTANCDIRSVFKSHLKVYRSLTCNKVIGTNKSQTVFFLC